MLVKVSIDPAGVVKIVKDTGLEIECFTRVREAAEYLKSHDYKWVFGSDGWWRMGAAR